MQRPKTNASMSWRGNLTQSALYQGSNLQRYGLRPLKYSWCQKKESLKAHTQGKAFRNSGPYKTQLHPTLLRSY